MRSPLNQEVLSAFENRLHNYFIQHLPQAHGLPTVEYFAGQSGYTTKYFSDLIKKSTGMGAQDYITAYILDLAKHKLLIPGSSIKETAYELGFQHPQHFTRFFRNHVGVTPKDFKSQKDWLVNKTKKLNILKKKEQIFFSIQIKHYLCSRYSNKSSCIATLAQSVEQRIRNA